MIAYILRMQEFAARNRIPGSAKLRTTVEGMARVSFTSPIALSNVPLIRGRFKTDDIKHRYTI